MSKIQCLPLSLAVVGFLACAGQAAAQCCPSGGTNPAPKATTGLGEASPAATDLSVDPAWKVYQFERDGITYLQVNDFERRVRSAVGRVGDTVWVMPVGVDADRVSIATGSTIGAVVYNSEDFVVRVVKGTDNISWIIVPLRKP